MLPVCYPIIYPFGFTEHAVEGELLQGLLAAGSVHQILKEGKKLVYGELCITQNLA